MASQEHAASVRVLTSILRAEQEARPVWLLGAGASFSSGVPLAAPSVMRIAKRVYAERELGGRTPVEQIKAGEWQAWLQKYPWYIHGEDRLGENFPLVVEHLLRPREYRTRILLDLLVPTNGIGAGYRRLAELVMRGLAKTIMTTNFDTCLPDALNALRPHIRHVAEVNRAPGDLREFGLFNRAQIVWLHGKAEQYSDRNDQGEIEKLDPRMVKQLVPLIASSPLIVAGYRGSEPSVMEHLLGRNAKATHNFKNGIFWCIRKGETLHPNVEALARAVRGNFTLLPIDGFDELLTDLSIELAGQDVYSTSTVADQTEVQGAFDDQAAVGVPFDALDFPLMLSTMRDYCAKLGRAPVTSESLKSLLVEQGLLVRNGGELVPTNGCVLLFARAPQTLFPHAFVSVSIGGKKRQVFEGNLIDQRRQLLEWFEGPEINPTLRLKGRNRHHDQPAYPHRALVELVVNMLVHRDYEIRRPSQIEVKPGGSITFRNPGGLTDPLPLRLSLKGGRTVRTAAKI